MSSILGKVMDNITVSLHSDVLHTTDMQFGFKASHSTTQCSFVVEEIMHYYKVEVQIFFFFGSYRMLVKHSIM